MLSDAAIRDATETYSADVVLAAVSFSSFPSSHQVSERFVRRVGTHTGVKSPAR